MTMTNCPSVSLKKVVKSPIKTGIAEVRERVPAAFPYISLLWGSSAHGGKPAGVALRVFGRAGRRCVIAALQT